MAAVITDVGGDDLEITPTGSAQVVLCDNAGTQIQAIDGDLAPAAAIFVGGESDAVGRHLSLDVEGATRMSSFLTEFDDPIDGAVINTAKWTSTVTTFANAQANRVMTMNSAASVAANGNSTLISPTLFGRSRGEVLRLRTMARLIWVANSQMEIGFGSATGAATPTSGVYLKIGLAGQVDLVVNFAGAEVVNTIASSFVGAGFLTTSYYLFDLAIYDDRVHLVVRAHQGIVEVAPIIDFWCQLAASAMVETSVISSPVLFRVFTSASVPASAPQLLISSTAVFTSEQADVPSYEALMAIQNRSSLQVPVGAIANTANHVNSTGPVTSAALSNTAASYATLGGQWQLTPLVTAEVDYLIFSYPVPVGYQFVFTGIRIVSMNTVVPVATTATVMQWAVGRGVGATLATRLLSLPVGIQSFPIGAAVGALAVDIDTPVGPFTVESGQHVQVSLKLLLSTVTATELFRGIVVVRGYFRQ